MQKADILKAWFKAHPEFTSTLKDGGEEGIIQVIEGNRSYEARSGQLVNTHNNMVTDTETLIKANCRGFIKPLSSGRYMGKHRDERTQKDRADHITATKSVLSTWLDKHGYVLPDEARRAWLDVVSQGMVYESDGNGGFVLRQLVNGVPVSKYKPEELFGQMTEYIDESKTRLNQLRLKAKHREEAFRLSGLTPAQVEGDRSGGNDAKFQEVLKLVEAEHFSQPTLKKLPEVPQDSLIEDLEKEVAFDLGLPIDRAAWTLNEKTKIKALAADHVTALTREPFERLAKYKHERPPKFFADIREKYEGLTYPETDGN